MVLSTGKVGFPIEFDNGDKEVIYFNPNDKKIQERIQEFEASVDKRIKEINLEKYKSRFENNIPEVDIEDPEKLLELSADELKQLQERLNVVSDIEKEYNDAIKAELDIVFDSKISDIAFKYCEPFDVVVIVDENGKEKREMYVMHFLNWLMIELKKYGIENKSAIDKHLSKYTK